MGKTATMVDRETGKIVEMSIKDYLRDKDRYYKPNASTYQDMAKQQGEINQQAAQDQFRTTNPNQESPFGSVNWTENDGGRPTVTTTLNPGQQQILDQSQRLMNQGLMATNLGQELDMSSLPEAPEFSLSGIPDAPDLSNTLTRDRLAQSLIDRDQPFMDRTRSRRETQLSNQGIMQGSTAYQSAQDDLSRAENDFRLGAFARAGDEQAREYGLQADARGRAIDERAKDFGFKSDARQRSLAELLTKRQLPLNELNALRTGAQVTPPSAQSFGGYNYRPTDMYGAFTDQVTHDIARNNAQAASRDNFTSGLFGLGGAALMNPWGNTGTR